MAAAPPDRDGGAGRRPGMIRRLRWVGFAGTVLLAVGGILAGARPGPAPASQAEALWGEGAGFRLGLLAYLVGLVLLGWAWWRLRRAVEGGRPGLRWVLVTGGLWALPLLVAPPLGSRDVYAYACQGALWLDGHDPYAVGAATGGCPWQEAVPSVWQETTAPYGPLA
ncbi:MAG: polyprenol phosphomannose-dependent alpha 1,6 mannosyltransferase MptB, partial [Natronosporangium sp.]